MRRAASALPPPWLLQPLPFSFLPFSAWGRRCPACNSSRPLHTASPPSSFASDGRQQQQQQHQQQREQQQQQQQPTVAQLAEAFQLYRRIMRANRRALQQPSARSLADAFVKSEFRSHMASASAALLRSSGADSQQQQQQQAASAAAEESVSSTCLSLSREEDEAGGGEKKREPADEAEGPTCTGTQFQHFLSAWQEYLIHATNSASPLHVGRSLKPSQRKLLSIISGPLFITGASSFSVSRRISHPSTVFLDGSVFSTSFDRPKKEELSACN
ncbi:hypothetical protein Efla_006950 [Eimeria flavescens]